MNIQTSQIWINQKTVNSFHKNWNTNDTINPDPNILDSGINSPKKLFQVTLRIPMQLQGSNGHMLINAKLLFLKNNNKAITLAISCRFTKPLIFSFFLGFSTSLVFVFPYCFFSGIHVIVPFLAGMILTAIYFSRFYYKIKRVSDSYLVELEKKYQSLANNSTVGNFQN